MNCKDCNVEMDKRKKFWSCPECGKSVELTVEETLEKYFNFSAFTEFNSILAHEYYRLYVLLEEKKYYGALLQTKDVLEVLLKLPILIVSNYLLANSNNQEEDEIIKMLLQKPLSLGDWEIVGKKILKIKENERWKLDEVIKILKSVCNIYDKYKIVKWRNENIGHGALSFKVEENFFDEMGKVLLAIKKHTEDCYTSYTHLELINKNGIAFVGKNNVKNVLREKDMLLAKIRGIEVGLYPFIIVKNKTPNLFDSFNYRYCDAYIIDYLNGDKNTDIEIAKTLKEKSKALNISVLEMDNIKSESFFSEHTKLLNRLEDDSNSFIKPIYILEQIKNNINTYKKGIFMLQMERGMGKSTVCKSLDQLNYNKMNIDNDTVVRVYYINDTINYKLGYFQDKCIEVLKDLKVDTIDITFNPSFIGRENKKKAFADMLNHFHKEYISKLGKNKLCFIIDGLDEIKKDNEESIFDYIPNSDYLNEGVYILLTSRVDTEIRSECSLFVGKNISIIEENLTKEKSVFYRDNPNNELLLKEYLKKYVKTSLKENEINKLLKLGEYRFLYIKALKELSHSVDDFEKISIDNNNIIINKYIKVLNEKYGNEKNSRGLIRIILILAIVEEPLTIEEISYLYGEYTITLKFIAYIIDLKGLLKIERSSRGNIYSLHKKWKDPILKENKKEVNHIINSWIDKIKIRISNKLKTRSDGESYLNTYLYELIKNYSPKNLELFKNSEVLEYLSSYARLLNKNNSFIYEKVRAIRIYTTIEEILLYKKNKHILDNFWIEILIERGSIYYSFEYYQKALLDFENAEKLISNRFLIYKDYTSIRNMLNSFYNLSKVYYQLKRFNKSLEILNKAKLIIPKIEDEKMKYKEIINICTGLGNSYVDSKNYEKGINEYNQALSLLCNSNELINSQYIDIMILYLNRGRAYRHLKKFELSLSDYNECEDIHNIMQEKGQEIREETTALIYLNKGSTLLEMQKYSEALKYFNKSLDIFNNKIESNTLENNSSMIMLHNNIAGVLYKLDKYDEALNEYDNALKIIKEMKEKGKSIDSMLLCGIYINKCNIYEKMECYDEQLSCIVKTEKICLEYSKYEKLKCYKNLDLIYKKYVKLYERLDKKNDLVNIYTKWIKVKSELAKSGDYIEKNNLAARYINRGLVEYKLKEYDKAIRDYDNAIRIIMEVDSSRRNLSNLAIAYRNRAAVNEVINNNKEAIHDYKEEIKIRRIKLKSEEIEEIKKIDEIYKKLISLNEKIDNVEGMIEGYSELIEIRKKVLYDSNWKNNLAAAYIKRGQLYYALEEDNKALEDYNKAIDTINKIEDEKKNLNNLAIAYNERANTNDILGNIEEAILDFTEEIKIRTKSHNKKNILAERYLERGLLYEYIENYKLAHKDYTDAIIILNNLERNIKNINSLIEAYSSRARIFIISKNYNNTIEDLKNEIKLRNLRVKSGTREELIGLDNAYNLLVGIYRITKNNDEMFQSYKYLIKIRSELAKCDDSIVKNNLAATYINRAYDYYKLKMYDEGLTDCNIAIKLINKIITNEQNEENKKLVYNLKKQILKSSIKMKN